MPTTTQATRESILDAAEQLFAEKGFEATSLRHITTAACVNLAAVNYHFGSKSELLQTMLQRLIAPVKIQEVEALEALLDHTPQPTLEEILGAFILPLVNYLYSDDPRVRIRAQVFARAIVDPNEEIQRIILAEVQSINASYSAILGRVLPTLPEAELQWRFISLFGICITHVVGVLSRLVPDHLRTTTKELEYQRILTFMIAGFQAPPPEKF
ncbi:TetR family transcriptional regulator [Dictyobacter alpinus]|uniref:TetR family transcriptional regulator n=1 Tax=Dictyobacter alpinus TaxID=2014873 RepID=A0A402BCH8_9CHLR|nr:TetR/AcrR family transcriptional regulator [Dictyobacter alpinus]GCE29065.1 TetR family transcriptional regulator [Dictyobacter alpinus]